MEHNIELLTAGLRLGAHPQTRARASVRHSGLDPESSRSALYGAHPRLRAAPSPSPARPASPAWPNGCRASRAPPPPRNSPAPAPRLLIRPAMINRFARRPLRTPGCAPRLQGRDEFVGRHIGLAQDASQGAHLDFAVHGDDAAFGATAHDDVASGLTQLFETQTLQRPYYGSARNTRQLRHARER